MSSEYDEGVTISTPSPKVRHLAAIERFEFETRWRKSVTDEPLATLVVGSYRLASDQILSERQGWFFYKGFSFHTDVQIVEGN
jgi:hypothetical protein